MLDSPQPNKMAVQKRKPIDYVAGDKRKFGSHGVRWKQLPENAGKIEKAQLQQAKWQNEVVDQFTEAWARCRYNRSLVGGDRSGIQALMDCLDVSRNTASNILHGKTVLSVTQYLLISKKYLVYAPLEDFEIEEPKEEK